MKISELKLNKKLNHEPIPYQLLLLADETVKSINKYIHNCEIYLLRSDRKTIGVSALKEIDGCTIEIKNLAIIEKYRSCGVGSWCLQKIEEIFPNKNLLVATGDGSIDALRFYKKNGFKKYAIRKNFFLKNYDHTIFENGIQLKDQIVMKKTPKTK